MIDQEKILMWFDERWLPIVIVLVAAWIARHFGGMVIDKIIRRTVRSTHLRRIPAADVRKRQDTLVSMLLVVWKVIVFVVTFLVLFTIAFPQIDLLPLFASAGIVGVAVGFGAQSLIKDFFAGMFIILENQYRVGDVVDIDGAGGVVERVTLRCTILRDIDGNVHYLPNGNILHAINKTMDYSKVYFTLSVHPDVDIDRLAAIIKEVGEKMSQDEKWRDKIIEAPTFLNLGAFNDIALEVNITGKTQPSEQWGVTSELKKRLIKELAKQKIQLSQYSPVNLATPGRTRK